MLLRENRPSLQGWDVKLIASDISRAMVDRARAGRYSHLLSLLMIDIDHFKKVNDTYGHQVGDEVLRARADQAHGLDLAGAGERAQQPRQEGLGAGAPGRPCAWGRPTSSPSGSS